MKLRKKIIISVSVILIIISSIVIYNIKNPVIKGLYGGRGAINYNGESAESCVFFTDFNEAEHLGYTEDKNFQVYAYKDDSNYKLFTLVGSDNTDCYKTESYVIPTSGEVTKVFIDPAVRSSNNEIITRQEDIEIFKRLVSYKMDEGTYHINNIYTEGTELYFAYDNCPVATYDNLVGYIAYIDNNWIIVSEEHYRNCNKREYSNEVDLLGSKIIDSELIEWLNKNSTEAAPPSYKEKQ